MIIAGPGVGPQNCAEMTLTVDQHPVRALNSYRPHPAFGTTVRPLCRGIRGSGRRRGGARWGGGGRRAGLAWSSGIMIARWPGGEALSTPRHASVSFCVHCRQPEPRRRKVSDKHAKTCPEQRTSCGTEPQTFSPTRSRSTRPTVPQSTWSQTFAFRMSSSGTWATSGFRYLGDIPGGEFRYLGDTLRRGPGS